MGVSIIRRLAVVPAVAALVLAGACSSAEDEAGGATGPGVTSEPCPNAVDKAKGCIYLGVLSDLEGGPFAALGRDINDGQLAFWKKVNEAGGIGGKYEVDIATHTKNTSYDPQKHAEAYQQVEPNVLALSMSLGTIHTQAVLDRMDAANLVSVAGTLWSGWQFKSIDKGLLLETGYSYCSEAIMGLDWLAQNKTKPTKLVSVTYKGDYGGDYATGAKKWAEANGVQVANQIQTGPNAAVGNQDGAVSQIIAAAPDVVMLATGPAEAGEIIGKAAAAGYKGRFLGSGPTWNGGLLKSAAAPAITALYNSTSPVDGWDGTSEAAKAAKAAATKEPATWGFSAGWAFSYPMKALLTKAQENGKLNRKGMRDTVDGLEVDFQGGAPKYTYGSDKPDLTKQRAIVGAPDAASPLGTKTLLTDYHGPTQDKVTLSEPCVQP
ncbi:ABC transporter substrate-binding protein [Nocardia sp. NPDC051832]|uniref:ABC transporter substrate-binding protein n=1 Tax=Nocardia sp. NPDC051832 TaxID=3155673 RepID=UPI00341FC63B